jgi:SAM-dependent methyltransferase
MTKKLMVMRTVEENKRLAVEQTMRDFRQFFSLNGGRVLEIASEGNAAAERLLELGADIVVCSNIVEDAQVVKSDRISYIKADATNTGFDSSSFDMVFGRAVLEHISSISSLKAEVTRILKPGGVFYLDGAPMWYSPSGHHLWLKAPSGHLYTFGDEDCPIRDWEHLFFSENEMLNILLGRGIDKSDAAAMSHYIYHAEGQNRLTSEAICQVFQDDSLLDVAIIRHNIPAHPPKKLISKFEAQDLTTWRLVLAGRKRSSETEPYILSTMTKNLTKNKEMTSLEIKHLRDSFYSSMSWRVTSPLRWLGRTAINLTNDWVKTKRL